MNINEDNEYRDDMVSAEDIERILKTTFSACDDPVAQSPIKLWDIHALLIEQMSTPSY